MSITGNFVAADEALRLGLVNHVVAHDELLPFARRAGRADRGDRRRRRGARPLPPGQDLDLAGALALETDHVAGRTFDAAGVRRRRRADRRPSAELRPGPGRW